MIEKGIRVGIHHSIYWYAKANNIYIKDYNKKKESSYLQYWDVINLYGWTMSKKLPVNNSEWIKDTSQFNEDFIKDFIKDCIKDFIKDFIKMRKDILFNLMFNILKNWTDFIMIYHFYLNE